MTEKLTPKKERRFIAPIVLAFVLALAIAGWAFTRAQKTNHPSNAPAVDITRSQETESATAK